MEAVASLVVKLLLQPRMKLNQQGTEALGGVTSQLMLSKYATSPLNPIAVPSAFPKNKKTFTKKSSQEA
jgi:hypothetical protein